MRRFNNLNSRPIPAKPIGGRAGIGLSSSMALNIFEKHFARVIDPAIIKQSLIIHPVPVGRLVRPNSTRPESLLNQR
jgi:hypothetical protein